jgi:predicted amidohydrolase YtcJ
MQALGGAPDLILFNAHVVTMDPALPKAQAMAVRKNRIVAVGNNDDLTALAGRRIRKVDAEGALLLPGMCDAHIHFTQWSLNLTALPIADAASKAELLLRLADAAARSAPGAWIIARGWNEAHWGDVAFPTAADLDGVTGPDRPTLLYRSDMHTAIANSAALRAAGIDGSTRNPVNGIIERGAKGTPTGVLKEAAIDLVAAVVPPPSDAERAVALRQGMTRLHQLGVTSIHDQRVWAGDEGSTALRDFQRLRRSGDLHLRVACNMCARDLPHLAALGVQSSLGDDMLWLGHAKFFVDGSLGSRTAWMLEPFEAQPGDDPTNTGVFVTTPDEMASIIRSAEAAGFPVSVHAIGDRANRELLDLFEEVARSHDVNGPHCSTPHRVEHAQTLHPDDLPRLAALGLTASVQPMHCLDDMEVADALLGDRTATTYAFRSLLDAGTRLAFGSDAPVADPSPWLGMHAAVTRRRPGAPESAAWHPEQCINLMQAVAAYTVSAAEAAGKLHRYGTLSAGKRADAVLLDRDLVSIVEAGDFGDAIAQTRARMTLFNGAVVWEA